jgi:hypothetical protein
MARHNDYTRTMSWRLIDQKKRTKINQEDEDLGDDKLCYHRGAVIPSP